jgi:hypothetical protein
MAITVRKTVKPTGGDYNNVNSAVDYFQATYPDFVSNNIIGEIEISEEWSADDTSAIDISGLTTDATHYLYIHAVGDARHSGKWTSTAHVFGRTAGDNIVNNSVQYVLFDGIQIRLVDASNSNGIKFSGTFTSGANQIILKNCLLKGPGTSTNAYNGIYNGIANCNLYLINTAIWGLGTGGADIRGVDTYYANTTHIYNCVVIGGRYSICCGGGLATVIAKNSYAGGSATEDYYFASGTFTKVNCASEDQSADDTSTGETQTNCIAAAIPLSTDTFTNVTGGSEDFHIKSTGALYHAGVDTSGEDAPLNFTTDIDGDTYYSTRSIGIDEVPAGGAVDRIIVINENVGINEGDFVKKEQPMFGNTGADGLFLGLGNRI